MWARCYEPHAATGFEPRSRPPPYDMSLWKLATEDATFRLARILKPLEDSWHQCLVPSRPQHRPVTVHGDTGGQSLRAVLPLPGPMHAQRSHSAADGLHRTVDQTIAKLICGNAQFAQSDVSVVRVFERTCACTNSPSCRTPTAPLSATAVVDLLRIGV